MHYLMNLEESLNHLILNVSFPLIRILLNLKGATSSPPLNGSTILSDNIIGLALNSQPLMRFNSMRDDLNQ